MRERACRCRDVTFPGLRVVGECVILVGGYTGVPVLFLGCSYHLTIECVDELAALGLFDYIVCHFLLN